MIIVTDTHPWVWFLTANHRLSSKAKVFLSDSSNLIIIPSIVVLEVKYLYSRKRISVSFEEVLGKTETSENVVIHPLDIDVATCAPVKMEIHDAIIVGTVLYLSDELNEPVPLVTRDKAISDSQLVQTIW